MAKFRYHRGGLRESMETVIEVSSKQDLVDKVEPDIFGDKPNVEQITVEPYGYDNRIDWNTYIVTKTIPGKDGETETGVMGFTDGPLD